MDANRNNNAFQCRSRMHPRVLLGFFMKLFCNRWVSILCPFFLTEIYSQEAWFNIRFLLECSLRLFTNVLEVQGAHHICSIPIWLLYCVSQHISLFLILSRSYKYFGLPGDGFQLTTASKALTYSSRRQCCSNLPCRLSWSLRLQQS